MWILIWSKASGIAVQDKPEMQNGIVVWFRGRYIHAVKGLHNAQTLSKLKEKPSQDAQLLAGQMIEHASEQNPSSPVL